MDNKNLMIGVIAVLIIGGLFYGFQSGLIPVGPGDGKDTEKTGQVLPQQPVVIVQQPQQIVQPVNQQILQPVRQAEVVKLPVEDLKIAAKNKFTMASVTQGNISFYTTGSDVSDPYVLPLDRMSLTSGGSTARIVQTATDYDVYYDSQDGTYYDQKLQNWAVNYNAETGKGYLMINDLAYLPLSPVGAFVDVDTLPEYVAGMTNESGLTDSLCYNESVLGGSGWFYVDIGNNNANSELRDTVLCFRDSDSDMENNELTGFSASYVSGSTAVSIPGNLLTYWQDAMGGSSAQCLKIADVLGGSQKARWSFTITVDETTFDVGEEFEMGFDDLGDYKARQYPSRNVKVANEELTICNSL